MQSAAVALFWWAGARNDCGARPVNYDPAKGVTIKPYQSKGGIVGNDPCVVPVRLKILADYNGTLHTCAEIPPANRARSHTVQRLRTFQFNQKLPPRAPAPNKANQIFALHGRVLLGEVLGERGRFGGRDDRFCNAKSVNSGFAALTPSPKEGALSLQGLSPPFL